MFNNGWKGVSKAELKKNFLPFRGAYRKVSIILTILLRVSTWGQRGCVFQLLPPIIMSVRRQLTSYSRVSSSSTNSFICVWGKTPFKLHYVFITRTTPSWQTEENSSNSRSQLSGCTTKRVDHRDGLSFTGSLWCLWGLVNKGTKEPSEKVQLCEGSAAPTFERTRLKTIEKNGNKDVMCKKQNHETKET